MVNLTNAPSGGASAPATVTLPDTMVAFLHNTTQYTYASPAGTTNNVGGGFPSFVGRVRLTVTLAAGAATWTGLGAGVDGQQVELWNNDATNTLTLTVGSANSLTNNRFKGYTAGYAVAPGMSLDLRYYAGNVNGWVVR